LSLPREIHLLRNNTLCTSVLRGILQGIHLVYSSAKFLFLGITVKQTMEFVERPWGKKVIPVHLIYSVKVDEFGNVTRFKAQLVAQGCRQIPSIDVDEVFAPTSSFGARRALLSVAAAKDFEVHQVDIKTAFLNGDLEEEVFVT
jgi:hypothetical protein